MWTHDELREEAISLAETITHELVRLSKGVNLNDGYQQLEVGETSDNPYLTVGISDINLTLMHRDFGLAHEMKTWINNTPQDEVAHFAMGLGQIADRYLNALEMGDSENISLIFTHTISGWSEENTTFFVGIPTPIEWDSIEDERETLKEELRRLCVLYLVIEEGLKDHLI